jgi:hypothetical protein
MGNLSGYFFYEIVYRKFNLLGFMSARNIATSQESKYCFTNTDQAAQLTSILVLLHHHPENAPALAEG